MKLPIKLIFCSHEHFSINFVLFVLKKFYKRKQVLIKFNQANLTNQLTHKVFSYVTLEV